LRVGDWIIGGFEKHAIAIIGKGPSSFFCSCLLLDLWTAGDGLLEHACKHQDGLLLYNAEQGNSLTCSKIVRFQHSADRPLALEMSSATLPAILRISCFACVQGSLSHAVESAQLENTDMFCVL
jgi:hypothetical protein